MPLLHIFFNDSLNVHSLVTLQVFHDLSPTSLFSPFPLRVLTELYVSESAHLSSNSGPTFHPPHASPISLPNHVYCWTFVHTIFSLPFPLPLLPFSWPAHIDSSSLSLNMTSLGNLSIPLDHANPLSLLLP